MQLLKVGIFLNGAKLIIVMKQNLLVNVYVHIYFYYLLLTSSYIYCL